MSGHDSAKNIVELIESIKPELIDMRGDHDNRVRGIRISYDFENDEFDIFID